MAKPKPVPVDLPIDESAKLNDKQEQVLQGAMQVFLKHGYAGTSMDRVATAAGVSKQTIYSHFQDKESLFTVLIERTTLHHLQHELQAESFCGEPAKLLHQLAELFMKKRTDPEYLNLLRVVIGESARFPELAQLYTRTVIQKGRSLLSQYFQSHPELNVADPEAAAHIFIGSLVSFLISQEILYGKEIMPMDQERLIDTLVPLILSRSSS